MDFTVFNNEAFGSIRIKEINGETWFVGKDICDCLEVKNVSDALSRLDDDEKDKVLTDTLGGQQNMFIVNESGLYSLVLSSRKPESKQFKKWVTNDVLPTIRKTGGYVASSEKFVESYFGSLDDSTKKFLTITLDDKLRVEAELKQANAKLEEQKPLVSFAESVAKSSDSIDIGSFAKLIKDEGVNLGRNKLFNWLRENKYLMDNNIPYQKYINNKYFEVVEIPKNTSYGTKIFLKTLVMPIAQIKIIEKLKAEFYKEMI